MGNARAAQIGGPLFAIASLTWLMVGCVYVPWFELAKLTGTRRDFRDLSGKSAADPIVDGRVTREQVLRLLGPPAAESPNGRVLAYTMTTRHGVWIEPLCLNVTAGGQHLYAVGLRFDAAGVLEHHRFVTEDVSPDLAPGVTMSAEYELGLVRRGALKAIDRDNGVVPAVQPNARDHSGQPARAGVREGFSVAGRGDPFTNE